MRYRDQSDDEDGAAMLDVSIVGDEEEQHRIELENNLQDLSIQLSLSNPSHASDQEHSLERCSRYKQSESSFELEYPRHNPRPLDVSIFHGPNSSFLDNTQLEQEFNPNYYSHHDIDVNADVHYIGNTMSTTGHHASAVTLSAGLSGRRDKRVYAGEASLSGAEYDPDRPLDSVLNGVANDLSMLNMDNTLTRGNRTSREAPIAQTQVTFDPLIVDRDHAATGGSKRRLAKAHNPKQAQDHATSFHSNREQPPKVKTKTKRPAVNVHVPTPSMGANATSGSSTTNGSKFTRLAKTLAREIEASQRWASAPVFEDKPPVKPSRKKSIVHRSPFRDVVNHSLSLDASSFRPIAKARVGGSTVKTTDTHINDLSRHEWSESKLLVLPDVTGLTSIVGSPTRKDQRRYTYSGEGGDDRMEVELIKTLTTLQTRLNQLESQNLVSRRRVRELELELESCRLEVKRERTRVLEKEEIIVAQQRDFQKLRSAAGKPVRKTPDAVSETRYNEVIEEKKALEALISTLRSHLSRLTDELSNQQSQLDVLRSMRDRDLRDLHDKLAEVETLSLEVERLGGEVDILRGVVEEGLNERRRAKQSMESMIISDESTSHMPDETSPPHVGCGDVVNDSSQADFPSPPPRPQSRQKCKAFGGRAQTSKAPAAGPSRLNVLIEERSTGEDELGGGCAEIEEHRSRIMHHHQDLDVRQSQSAHGNEHQENQRARFSGVGATKNGDRPYSRRVDEGCPKPSAPRVRIDESQTAETKTPFPRIRGERLERLFFSAPEHDEKTCRVCHRRRRPGASDDELDFPSWLPPRKRLKTSKENDRSQHRNIRVSEAESCGEELSDHTDPGVDKQAPSSEDRLPPQTVLVRVLRELEDDFTHYKGIYIELADQYKIMDAASNVPKRNVLAEHLKEVINTLEQKGDQIASLYDLLTFKDKSTSDSVVPGRTRMRRSPRSPRSSRQHGARHSGGLRKYATYS